MCVKMQYVYRNKYNGNKKREAEELVVRVLVSGGGTGGHIYPALALIREIKKVKSRSKIFIYWYGKWTREHNRSKSRYTISIYCYKWI